MSDENGKPNLETRFLKLKTAERFVLYKDVVAAVETGNGLDIYIKCGPKKALNFHSASKVEIAPEELIILLNDAVMP